MNQSSAWALPPEIRQRFGQKSFGKQRAMIAKGHLLLVLHKAPRTSNREREGILFWRRPDGSWHSSDGASGLAALEAHLEAYSTAEESLDRRQRRATDAEDYFAIVERVAPLRRAAKNLYNTLQSAREGVPDAPELIDLRDWAYTIDRSLDLLYMDTKNTLDFHMAKKAEEQTKISAQAVQTAHRLNILVAFFFPLMTISSIFGMNLHHGFEETSVVIFWIIFLIGILAGILIRDWALKSE